MESSAMLIDPQDFSQALKIWNGLWISDRLITGMPMSSKQREARRPSEGSQEDRRRLNQMEVINIFGYTPAVPLLCFGYYKHLKYYRIYFIL